VQLLKLTLALGAFVLCLALPAAYAVTATPGSKSVAQKLQQQMNSGPNGRITRTVKCIPAARGKAFDCDLQSVISTHIAAHVSLIDGGMRTVWEPLQG
jgi:hypothetical protein